MKKLFLMVLFISPIILQAAEKKFTLIEVSKHATIKDCWIVIEEKVYDVSSYIPLHPTSEEVIGKRCGKNADYGWKTKGRDKAHSSSAARLLKRYEIGLISK
jgi:cytochrome b involved in lipid metabolism